MPGGGPTVKRLLDEDPKIRVVYKEFPILGPESTMAAEAALASRAQGRYVEFHEALMKASGGLGWDMIARIAADIGLDVDRLHRDMRDPEIAAIIGRNHALARDLGISGTPAFVVGTELAPGALDAARLRELITRARSR
jgi:protein-disulfide isomerase